MWLVSSRTKAGGQGSSSDGVYVQSADVPTQLGLTPWQEADILDLRVSTPTFVAKAGTRLKGRS